MAGGLMTGPQTEGLQVLAIPGVCLLIAFLGYSSQWLFSTSLEPGPLTRREIYTFNALLACVWWTYYRACAVSPGRYTFPPPSPPAAAAAAGPSASAAKPTTSPPPSSSSSTTRWCKKCAAPKPPRAHHCRHCGRCVPRMDHHCPWTGNCVSLQTFPYFLRFLVWTNLALWYLAALLWPRLRAVWDARALPAYLGPSLPALVHLALLALPLGAVCLMLGILLVTTVRGWALNRTMIEGWELERHEALLERRARRRGDRGDWWDDGGGGGGAGGAAAAAMLEAERVEFPYDIGIFANMAQAMGTRNPLLWLLPLAGGPRVSPGGRGVGWDWPENGFNARAGLWPPPDPEKQRRAAAGGWPGASAAAATARRAGDVAAPGRSAEEEVAAFRERQARDLRRWRGRARGAGGAYEERSSGEEEEERSSGEEEEDDEGDNDEDEEDGGDDDYYYYEEGMDGEPGWTNSDGDRLRDYGVDEDAEDEEDVELIPRAEADDEDVPLAELIRRRKVLSNDGEDT